MPGKATKARPGSPATASFVHLGSDDAPIAMPTRLFGMSPWITAGALWLTSPREALIYPQR